jgi:hypothetical protein
MTRAHKQVAEQPSPIRLERELTRERVGVSRLTRKPLEDPKALPRDDGPSKRLAKQRMGNRNRSKPQTKNQRLKRPISLNIQTHGPDPSPDA